METTPLVLFVLVVIVVAVGTTIAVRSSILPSRRTARLRRRFGAEYEHAVRIHGDTETAERDLTARLSRRAELRLRAIPEDLRDGHVRAWIAVQQGFVDDPERSVRDARAVIAAIALDLGHSPGEDFERLLDTLSVDHPEEVAEVRRIRDDDTGGTEHLRGSLVAHRRLVDALLGGIDTVGRGSETQR
ncbi:hypothetical protein [Nocardiopsis lambiniae]|uniref:Secreted protein n=1 Tax=Nocardiopsis lambiniae TaxID=3075539 RepID=A0ABU2M2T2_9ACTN|nr:hypothetical protein [Nocardiopsis sp. DSM 44743]MDT0326878.1 hypothetical protein [Nocardiopsis sp. DSM 44743]